MKDPTLRRRREPVQPPVSIDPNDYSDISDENKKNLTPERICRCPETRFKRCGRFCPNRRMQIECGENCSSVCTNKELSQQKFAKVVQLSYKKENHLYAGEFIKKGRLIMEYFGEVKDKLYEHFDINSRPLMARNFVIDASKKGNEVRFINHMENANAVFRLVTVPGTPGHMPRIGVFASLDIEKGYEITVNYCGTAMDICTCDDCFKPAKENNQPKGASRRKQSHPIKICQDSIVYEPDSDDE